MPLFAASTSLITTRALLLPILSLLFLLFAKRTDGARSILIDIDLDVGPSASRENTFTDTVELYTASSTATCAEEIWDTTEYFTGVINSVQRSTTLSSSTTLQLSVPLSSPTPSAGTDSRFPQSTSTISSPTFETPHQASESNSQNPAGHLPPTSSASLTHPASPTVTTTESKWDSSSSGNLKDNSSASSIDASVKSSTTSVGSESSRDLASTAQTSSGIALSKSRVSFSGSEEHTSTAGDTISLPTQGSGSLSSTGLPEQQTATSATPASDSNSAGSFIATESPTSAKASTLPPTVSLTNTDHPIIPTESPITSSDLLMSESSGQFTDSQTHSTNTPSTSIPPDAATLTDSPQQTTNFFSEIPSVTQSQDISRTSILESTHSSIIDLHTTVSTTLLTESRLISGTISTPPISSVDQTTLPSYSGDTASSFSLGSRLSTVSASDSGLVSPTEAISVTGTTFTSAIPTPSGLTTVGPSGKAQSSIRQLPSSSDITDSGITASAFPASSNPQRTETGSGLETPTEIPNSPGVSSPSFTASPPPDLSISQKTETGVGMETPTEDPNRPTIGPSSSTTNSAWALMSTETSSGSVPSASSLALGPRPAFKVSINGISFIVPPCGTNAFEASIWTSADSGQRLVAIKLYCDKLEIDGTIFSIPREVENSPEVNHGAFKIKWNIRAVPSNLNIQEIQAKIDTFTGSIGGFLSFLGKFGSIFTRASFDAASGLDTISESFMASFRDTVTKGIQEADLELGTFDETFDTVIESARSIQTSQPGVLNLDKFQVDVLNGLADGIFAVKNHIASLANFVGYLSYGAWPNVKATLLTGLLAIGAVIQCLARLQEYQMIADSFQHFGTSQTTTEQQKRKNRPSDHNYLIFFKRETTQIEFEAVKTVIGDNNAGESSNPTAGLFQLPPSYFTLLNDSSVEFIKLLPRVAFVSQHPNAEDIFGNPDYKPSRTRPTKVFRSRSDRDARQSFKTLRSTGLMADAEKDASSNRSHTAKVISKRANRSRPASDEHLRLLSSRSGELTTARDYNYDDSGRLGTGSWIFVLDWGFNFSPELTNGARTIKTHVVPKDKTKPTKPRTLQEWEAAGWRMAPDNLADICPDHWIDLENNPAVVTEGHGTMVASVAAGQLRGVASGANLYLIKVANAVVNVQGRIGWAYLELAGLEAGLQRVFWAIGNERIRAHKSVVVLPFAGEFYDPNSKQHELWEAFFMAAESIGLTIVLSAGNDGINPLGTNVGSYVGDIYPAALGTPDNFLITVGGTDSMGRPWVRSSPEGNSAYDPDLPLGSVTVYAQAKGVLATLANGDTDLVQGTSFAAPAIAGLAAYYLTLPATAPFFVHAGTDFANGNSVGRRMKQWIVQTSYQRQPDSMIRDPTLYYPIFPTRDVNVGYNMVWGLQCKPLVPLVAPADNQIVAVQVDSCPARFNSSSTLGPSTFSTSTKSTDFTSSTSSVQPTIQIPQPIFTNGPDSCKVDADCASLPCPNGHIPRCLPAPTGIHSIPVGLCLCISTETYSKSSSISTVADQPEPPLPTVTVTAQPATPPPATVKPTTVHKCQPICDPNKQCSKDADCSENCHILYNGICEFSGDLANTLGVCKCIPK